MKKYGLLFWLVVVAMIVLGILLPIKIARINDLQKELTSARQSVVIAQQQAQIQESQMVKLSNKVSLLSKELEAAKSYQLLSYELKSGDTLYNLFGHSWRKIVKINNTEYAKKLPVGKTINFRGYTRRIKKGESFSKLFGKDWKRIAYLNGFCPQQAKTLPTGQLLKIPSII